MEGSNFLIDEENLSLLLEILHKLRQLTDPSLLKASNATTPKALFSQIFSLTHSLEKEDHRPTVEDFKAFLRQAHNVFVKGDTSVRSSLLRVIRYSIPEHGTANAKQGEYFLRELITEEFHWLVVTSFEREPELALERSQAFKLMSKVLPVAGTSYPTCFARSLVAVANVKEDPFRKPCLYLLRELSLVDPRLVSKVNGFSCLLDAVVEPLSPELAENILLSLMYLLNDQQLRQIVQPYIDLRILLSPFTDLDSNAADLSTKWVAAKNALVMLMRSWAGVVLISSDEMGLPRLVQMLRDPKVPVPTQDIILEVISEVLSPSDFKVRVTNRSRHQQVWTNAKSQALISKTPSVSQINNGSSSMLRSASSSQLDQSVDLRAPGLNNSSMIISSTEDSNSNMQHIRHYSISGEFEISSLSADYALATSQQKQQQRDHQMRSSTSQLISQQQSKSNFRPSTALTGFTSGNSSPPSGYPGGISGSGSSTNLASNARSSSVSGAPTPSPESHHQSFSEAIKPSRSHSTLALPNFINLNFFDRSSSPGFGKPKKGSTSSNLMSSGNNPITSSTSTALSVANSSSNSNSVSMNNSKVFATSATSMSNSISQMQRPIPKAAAPGNDFSIYGMVGGGEGSVGSTRSRQSSAKSSPDVHPAYGNMRPNNSFSSLPPSSYSVREQGFGNDAIVDDSETFDPIYNMMDSYTALLCCAFLHVDLIQSLYFLGIHGSMPVAIKSRKLMVKYLRVLANIFPESRCSELLTIPSIIEFAASANTSTNMNRAHKSSQILVSLAEAFSLMPYKQVSGKHVSRLNSVLNLMSPMSTNITSPTTPFDPKNGNVTTSTRPRSGNFSANSSSFITGAGGKGPVALSNAAADKGTNATSNNTTTTTTSGGSMFTFATNSRSNFASLNIQTVYELAEEIRISSICCISSSNNHSTTSGYGVADISGGRNCTMDAIKSLRASITPSVDKAEFLKQMDQSKVTGKEGKEPFKWDWVCISDMLEYSFQNSDRINEALRSKWLKRVCGFYRCSMDDKAYFANLDWEPSHLQYMECAFNLNAVLLQDAVGVSFLNTDRRGMLFVEIAQEIDLLTTSSGKFPTFNTMASQKNVFRLFSCNFTMTREFFTILGRALYSTKTTNVPNVSNSALHLLEGTNIFEHLCKISNFESLDYLSRLVFTSLSFTDGGIMSMLLLQYWTTVNTSCSTELRHYFHTLLRVLLSAKPTEMYSSWCVEAILMQLSVTDEAPSTVLYKALEEVVHNKSFLLTVISKRPKLKDVPEAQNIVMRFLAVSEGFDFLTEREKVTGMSAEESEKADLTTSKSWLNTNVKLWLESGSKNYADKVEEKISIALSKVGDSSMTNDDRPEMLRGVTPIPIQTPEFVGELMAQQGNYSSSSAATCIDNLNDPNSFLATDLHGLLRVPWNMEIKLTSQAGYQMQGSNQVVNPNSEYVKVDAFLDLSEMKSPFCYETTSDSTRLVRVRGIILDSKGVPSGQSIAQNRIISTTLMAGICPIFKDGRINSNSYGSSRTRRRGPSQAPHASPTPTMNGSRGSLSAVTSGSNNADVNGNSAVTAEDTPVTYQFEHLYEWFQCKPGHRQGQICELEDSRFSVSLPGEPVVWIFSRKFVSTNAGNSSRNASSKINSVTPTPNSSLKSGRKMSLGSSIENVLDTASNFGNISRHDTSRSGGAVFLVEVQYYLRLETGQALFVPMPRHLFGELARTVKGCDYLTQKKIVLGLLATCRYHPAISNSPATNCTNTSLRQLSQQQNGGGSSDHDQPPPSHYKTSVDVTELRAALWSLGHIGSTELGFKMIIAIDAKFVDFCVHNVCNCGNYSLRGTFFFVVGLLSRTIRGSKKLLQLQWEAAPFGGNSAVAMPKNASVLFQNPPPTPQMVTSPTSMSLHAHHNAVMANSTSYFNSTNTTTNATNVNGSRSNVFFNTHSHLMPVHKNLTPFMNQQSNSPGEAEMLNLIVKLPGVIIYRDSMHRLNQLKKERPELFNKRSLYVEVLKLLETYTFKLTARRDVLKLFGIGAKLK